MYNVTYNSEFLKSRNMYLIIEKTNEQWILPPSADKPTLTATVTIFHYSTNIICLKLGIQLHTLSAQCLVRGFFLQ